MLEKLLVKWTLVMHDKSLSSENQICKVLLHIIKNMKFIYFIICVNIKYVSLSMT